MTDWHSTGFPAADAKDDFSRARRREQWARVATRLRGRPGDVRVLLPFDEVVTALGMRGKRRVGERLVGIAQIVGSVDRTRDFDRSFRPTSSVARARFERIAAMARRGDELPPVDLYRIGRGKDALYFVLDGHHRIAVASALGRDAINARVTEIVTQLPVGPDLLASDLLTKTHERLFNERVPLPEEVRDAIRLRDPAHYARLAEGVEAWGFRVMQETGEPLDRQAVAARWWIDEYEPAIRLLREAGLIETPTTQRAAAHDDAPAAGNDTGNDTGKDTGNETMDVGVDAADAADAAGTTEAEAYLRLAEQRYLLLRSHDWDEKAMERLRSERPRRRPGRRRRPARP